jgi:hypothetical protein
LTEKSKAPIKNCSGCWKDFPVEQLVERVGGRNRKLRYCPVCLARRERAMVEVSKVKLSF